MKGKTARQLMVTGLCASLLFGGTAMARGQDDFDREDGQKYSRFFKKFAHKLELSDAQIKSLKVIQKAQMEKRQAKKAQIEKTKQKVQALINAKDFDQSKAKVLAKKFTKAKEESRSDRLVAHWEVKHQMLQVLNEKQRKALHSMCQSASEKMSERYRDGDRRDGDRHGKGKRGGHFYQLWCA